MVSDIIKTIGLLAKQTFDRKIGIDNIYLKGFLSLVPNLLNIGL